MTLILPQPTDTTISKSHSKLHRVFAVDSLASDQTVVANANNSITVNSTVLANSFVGNLTGNASTVTNGVYKNTNNTLTGTNTFTGNNTFTANNTFTGSVVVPNATANTNPVTLGQFPSSIGTSGWKKFPDPNTPTGYFIIQWMVAPESTSSSDWKTLPMTFPNVNFGGHVTPAEYTITGGGGQIVSKTTSQIVFRCGDSYNNGTNGFVTVWGY